MPAGKRNGEPDRRSVDFSIKLIGQFILLSVIGMVGWSFLTVMQHETAIAVMQGNQKHIEEKLKALEVRFNHAHGNPSP